MPFNPLAVIADELRISPDADQNVCSPYGAVRSLRLRGAFCASAHLPAAQRRLMVMPFGSCQKLGRSFPCSFLCFIG